MNKKKLSGQTIAILILAIALLLAIGFGGVYAYFSVKTSNISGKIVMAHLNITVESGINGESGKSEIVISNSTNVVPNQILENTPLVVRNLSTIPVYLAVVYEVKAYDTDDALIVDEFLNPVIDIGSNYYNPNNTKYNKTTVNKGKWVDYVYNTVEEGQTKKYRCLVSMQPFPVTPENGDGITVIGENRLKLSRWMGNEYQSATISFTFQAYAIGDGSFPEFTETTSEEQKCFSICDAIHFTVHKFLDIN